MENIIEAFTSYMNSLDWVYIFSLVLLAEIFTRDAVVKHFPFGLRELMIKVPKGFRVLILGLSYGITLYWMRDYQGKTNIEILFNSLVFSMVFYELIGRSFFMMITRFFTIRQE